MMTPCMQQLTVHFCSLVVPRAGTARVRCSRICTVVHILATFRHAAPPCRFVPCTDGASLAGAAALTSWKGIIAASTLVRNASWSRANECIDAFCQQQLAHVRGYSQRTEAIVVIVQVAPGDHRRSATALAHGNTRDSKLVSSTPSPHISTSPEERNRREVAHYECVKAPHTYRRVWSPDLTLYYSNMMIVTRSGARLHEL